MVMKTIEEKEVEIRTTWFENHVAKVSKHEDVSVLYWGEPGTSMYSVKYVFSGCNLFISGDLGEAVFDLTWKASLESFEDINLGYLLKKLSCSSRDRWYFNDKLAKKELNEWFERYSEEDGYEEDFLAEAKKVKSAVIGAIDESSSCKDYEFWLWNAYHDVETERFDSEDFSMFSRFGEEMPYCYISYLVGMKMAIEQLKGVHV